MSGEVPEPRHAHTASLVRGHMFVIGGSNGAVALGEVHSLDLATCAWRRHAALPGAPHSRYHHAAEVIAGWGPDADRHAVVVFGGVHRSMSQYKPLEDVCVLDVTRPESPQWMPSPKVAGVAPAARFGHCSVSSLGPWGAGEMGAV